MDQYQNPEAYQQYQPEDGPRRMGFFTLILKTFLGLVGGVIGSLILLLIFLAAASILQPVLLPGGVEADQINPVFMVILMMMIFLCTLVSSLLTPFLLSFTERERYTRINSSIYQIFIINLVIFAFSAPLYLTTSVANLEFTAYAAGLQVILVSTAASLIMEIVNDKRYPLVAVYQTLLAILFATAGSLLLFQLLQSTTVLLFAVLPLTWMMIGFFQGAFPAVYQWYYSNWGVDFLAAETSYGVDYAADYAETQQEEEEEPAEDQDGSDFLKS